MIEKNVLQATIDGFLSELNEKTSDYDYGDLKMIFISFFQQFSLDQIIGLMEQIIEFSHPNAEDSILIEENIQSHCRLLHSIFKNL